MQLLLRARRLRRCATELRTAPATGERPVMRPNHFNLRRIRQHALELAQPIRLDGVSYRFVVAWNGDAVVHAEPFDALEIALMELWTALR